jgi:AcrR family transcriptional regulator
MTAEARKEQIVQVALKTIGKYGVQGATIARIAKAAGITTAALYTHFENRRAILLAALDKVYEQIFEIHEASAEAEAVQRLRDIGRAHSKVVTTQGVSGHAHLFLEFVAAAPERGLREAVLQKESAAAANLAQIVENGKKQGTIAEDVNPEEVALLIGAWAWAGDVALLLGHRSAWTERVSPKLLELILQSISTGTGGAPCNTAPLEESVTRPG